MLPIERKINGRAFLFFFLPFFLFAFDRLTDMKRTSQCPLVHCLQMHTERSLFVCSEFGLIFDGNEQFAEGMDSCQVGSSARSHRSSARTLKSN